MIQESEKKLEPVKIVLPISCVRDNGFDQKTFLEVSGRRWNGFYALNRLVTMISELLFLTKIPSLFLVLLRSFLVPCIRVMFAYV